MKKFLEYILTAAAAACAVALVESLSVLVLSDAGFHGAGQAFRFVLYSVSVFLLFGLAAGVAECVVIEGGGRIARIGSMSPSGRGRKVAFLCGAAVAAPLFALPVYRGSLHVISWFHLQYIMAFAVVLIAVASLLPALVGGFIAARLTSLIFRGSAPAAVGGAGRRKGGFQTIALLWGIAAGLPLFALSLYYGSLLLIRNIPRHGTAALCVTALALGLLAPTLLAGWLAYRKAAGRSAGVASAAGPGAALIVFLSAVVAVNYDWLGMAVDFRACGYAGLFVIVQAVLWKLFASRGTARVGAGSVALVLVAAAACAGALTPLLADSGILFVVKRSTGLEKGLVGTLGRIFGPPVKAEGVRIEESALVYSPPEEYVPDRTALEKITGDTEGMNVILITVDALRADHLGCYGYARDTSPNIDRFAKEGALFEHAFIQAADSPNSLYRLMTSRYLVNTVRPGGPETIAQIMKKNGYETAAVYDGAVWDKFRKSMLKGFDRYITTDFPYTKIFGMSTSPYLNRLALDYIRENRDRKMFIWMHYLEPHQGYLRHPELRDYGRTQVDAYDSEIAYVDKHFGELLGELKNLGIYDKTIIVFSADHGETFMEHGERAHGRQLYNESIRVPLIAKLPGVKDKKFPQNVKAIDVLPTLVQLLDLKTDVRFDGTSLVPLVYFGDTRYLSPVYTWITWKPLDAKMVMDGDWKLIHTTRDNTFELYNLKDDPGEKSNLFSQRPDVAQALGEKLFAWVKFALKEPVPSSPGAAKKATGGGEPAKKVAGGGEPSKPKVPESPLREPRDAAVGEDGTLYVADFGNKCVRVLSPRGALRATWGSRGKEPGKFRDPAGIAVDRKGNVYVADTWNHRIQKLDRAGKLVKVFKANFFAPAGVALDGKGNIYVADTGNGKVKKLDPSGRLLWQKGRKGVGPEEFTAPIGIAVSDGGVLVADSGNRRIQVLDAEGGFRRPIKIDAWSPGVFNLPYIDVDGKGGIYLSDPLENRVLRLSPKGKLLGELRPKEAGKDSLNRPTGIAVDGKRGDVYVVDTWNHRVRKFTESDFK